MKPRRAGWFAGLHAKELRKFLNLAVFPALSLALLLAIGTASAQTSDAVQACLMEQLANAPGEMTVTELRDKCAVGVDKGTATMAQEVTPEPDDTPAAEASPSGLTAWERRRAAERVSMSKTFPVLPHKPNYALIAAYNTKTYPEPFENEFGRDVDFDDVESKYQISLKFPLGVNLFDGRADLMAGYTLRAFWQVYNSDESSPFPDYNHEPEVWLAFDNDADILGLKNVENQIGYVHQSNGRGGDFLSRSWDRIYANFVFSTDESLVWVKPWVIIKDADENPDIDEYLGYGEIGWSWSQNNHTLTTMLRNHLESGFSKGTTELAWSFPIFNYRHLRGYAQVFNGYGENLMNYNKHNTSVGLGVSLTDWLQ